MRFVVKCVTDHLLKCLNDCLDSSDVNCAQGASAHNCRHTLDSSWANASSGSTDCFNIELQIESSLGMPA